MRYGLPSTELLLGFGRWPWRTASSPEHAGRDRGRRVCPRRPSARARGYCRYHRSTGPNDPDLKL
ncbi:hypothetical protein GCM10026982_48470 [Nocardiopsis aegyptia]